MDSKVSLAIFLGMVFFGGAFELVMSKFLLKKYHRFSIVKYLYLLLFPLAATIILINLHGVSLLKVFVIFAIVGTLLEWLLGFGYHKIVGQRLWIYHRLTITGYTSLLSTPIWGMAGIMFWLLVQSLGQ